VLANSDCGPQQIASEGLHRSEVTFPQQKLISVSRKGLKIGPAVRTPVASEIPDAAFVDHGLKRSAVAHLWDIAAKRKPRLAEHKGVPEEGASERLHFQIATDHVPGKSCAVYVRSIGRRRRSATPEVGLVVRWRAFKVRESAQPIVRKQSASLGDSILPRRWPHRLQ